MQLVAHVGHVGAAHDLTVARRALVDVEDAERIGPSGLAVGRGVERDDVGQLFGGRLHGRSRRWVERWIGSQTSHGQTLPEICGLLDPKRRLFENWRRAFRTPSEQAADWTATGCANRGSRATTPGMTTTDPPTCTGAAPRSTSRARGSTPAATRCWVVPRSPGCRVPAAPHGGSR